MTSKPTAARLDWRTIIEANDEVAEATISALDRYFVGFAQPPGSVDEYDGKFYLTKGHPCLKCDEPMLGFMSFLVGKGGFEWGLAHGEGHCVNCRWPARAHHFIKNEDGTDCITLRNFVLQYHPDFVEVRRRAS